MNHRAKGGAQAGLFGETPNAGRTGLRHSIRVVGGNIRSSGRLSTKKEPVLVRDSLSVIQRGQAWHIVSEDYSYKSEAYYHILSHELAGEPVCPSSRAVLDAFVVPVCLERAQNAGIPVADWGISQGYVPLPAVLYGLNYFATASDYAIVRDNGQAQDVVRHITNRGKYPFCYQKISDSAEVVTCTAVFGRTAGKCAAVDRYAEKIYDLFSIPLVRLVMVHSGNAYRLSSLAPMRYTHLSEEERGILCAFRDHQEFL